ncbi:MAG TPA: endonuclease Q family protein [Candidatus Bilamarchaeaceae archaeon]|nr:endonuclease Q family protein [Candidatus Bilamarchaeaceae archaeon]
MRIIADLHLHSKYSRATSGSSDLEGLAEWAQTKGIGLLGTADFTHPGWFGGLGRRLEDEGEGIFSFRNVKFLLSTEVSNIFYRGNVNKKVHNVIFAPSLEIVKQISEALGKYGKLEEDGRPTLNLDIIEMVGILRGISREIYVVPAHAWTPWFGVFGSKSGFDSLKEAFGEYEKDIFAIETGLSSDPGMNWMLSSLDGISLISNSDCHSPQKLGREANVFELERMTYRTVMDAIRTRKGFVKTYEFYPEEGKYHWDGHRGCGVCLSPEESIRMGDLCPVCKRKLTVGVLHRVEKLADRKEGAMPAGAVPFTRLIPLMEIIASVRDAGVNTKGVQEEYFRIVNYFGNEFAALEAPEENLVLASDKVLAKAIVKAREGQVYWRPGYDGEFGKMSWEKPKEDPKSQKSLMDF